MGWDGSASSAPARLSGEATSLAASPARAVARNVVAFRERRAASCHVPRAASVATPLDDRRTPRTRGATAESVGLLGKAVHGLSAEWDVGWECIVNG
eukprot:356567-Chlamydomonas_euryale.AAC.9